MKPGKMIKCFACETLSGDIDALQEHWEENHNQQYELVPTGRSFDIVCDTCGEVDVKKNCELGEHQFCAPECYQEFQRTDDLPYGPLFTQNREVAIRRDGERCVACGMTREEHQAEYGQDLHAHHITPRSDFENAEEAHATENLQTLCYDCHIVDRRWETQSP